MNSCTTLTAALHLRLQFPSPIALTTQLIALNTLLITLTHTADCTDHTAYLSHGLPLCHCRVLLSVYHPPDVRHIPSLSVFCYSFCLVLLCCLVVWFLNFCLLPGSSLCLALWILFADRRPCPFTWLLSCLALYMPVCHLLDPACVLTMSSNKSLHMDPHASRLVGPVTIGHTKQNLLKVTYSSFHGLCSIQFKHFQETPGHRWFISIKFTGNIVKL